VFALLHRRNEFSQSTDLILDRSRPIRFVLCALSTKILAAVSNTTTNVRLCFRHNDLPWNIRKFVHNQLMYFNFSADLTTVEPWSKSNWSQTDLPRLRKGMVGAQVSRDGNTKILKNGRRELKRYS